MNYRFWTPEEDAILRAMWEEKKSQADIAVVLNRTSNMVAGRVSHLGLRTQKRHRSHPWTMGDRFTLRAMWKTEASVPTIAQTIGVSEKTVRREARKLNLPSRTLKVQRKKKARLPGSITARRGGKRQDFRDLPPEPHPTHGMFYLPRNRCQWIANKFVPGSGDRQKCGAKTVPHRPYCPDHEARVWKLDEEQQAA